MYVYVAWIYVRRQDKTSARICTELPGLLVRLYSDVPESVVDVEGVRDLQLLLGLFPLRGVLSLA